MLYIYKKNNTYIYKRRIPNTNKFYTFNTTFNNYKKASKFVIIFNKITIDIFKYIKREGKAMAFDFNEVFEVLNDYKEKALKEYSDYEEKRHSHIGQLFKIEKEDPLMGTIRLSGGQPKVIKVALNSFENLAVGNYNEIKKHLKKHGKDIVSRATVDLKQLYEKIRTKDNEKDLLDLLGLILKTEADILKEDYSRAKNRFSPNNETNVSLNYDNNSTEKRQSFTEEQQKRYMLIEDIAKDFLFNECNYSEEDINNSKSNASKVKKVVEILIDIIKDTKKEQTSQTITFEILKECLNIIPQIPIKPKNQNGSYSFYFAYKENKNASKEELRGEKTIKQDLSSFSRFIKYLTKKEFIKSNEFLDLETHLNNRKKDLTSKVINSEIKKEKNRTAFKEGMLQKIFNKKYKPYSILFDKLKNDTTAENRDILMARFLVPIVLFFTGARPAEITFLKTSDCEIKNINGEERIILYLEANELKGSKTKLSRRIVIVHDFLAKELNFLDFIKNAIKEQREFLFNAVKDFETKVSVSFNRDKEFLEGNVSRIDDFNNLTYSLYSFRHTYKTHMLSKNVSETVVDKIQGHSDRKEAAGYFSITEDLIDTINSFDKHLIIDWDDIKIITNTFKCL
jgi:integrase